jgi:hypothetical protein
MPSKHTPGPLTQPFQTLQDASSEEREYYWRYLDEAGPKGKTFAVWRKARAAALDLLEALKAAEECLDPWQHVDQKTAARAAIAKAEEMK